MKLLLLFLSLPLFVIDQVTKYIIYTRFDKPFEPPRHYIDEITVIDGFFYIHRVHNKGIAFGTFNGGEYSNVIFGIVAATALVLLYWFAKKNAFPTRVGKVAVALLVAGILGNLTDRIVYGYVIDFLSFDLHLDFVGPRFASFNVADACISVAAVLLFVAAFQNPETESPDEAGGPAEPA